MRIAENIKKEELTVCPKCQQALYYEKGDIYQKNYRRMAALEEESPYVVFTIQMTFCLTCPMCNNEFVINYQEQTYIEEKERQA